MQGRGRRVAITGFGVVAPCGIGKDAFWQGLLGPAITGTKSTTFADWDPLPYYDSPKDARRADAVEQFAMASAIEAFEHAGRADVDPRRFGCIYGTGIGGLRTLEEQVQIRLDKGERRVSPFLVPMMMGNASGAGISMRYGLQGPLETICTACAAATHAIGYAARLIAWGRCDAMVTGGSEAAATLTSLAGFNNMTALSSSGSSRPFDAERDGFVMGEGSATFILEEWEIAVARGATIYGEILGSASTADAHHITAPAPGGVGAIHCMELALEDAGLQPEDITQINAHGTSTPLNDQAEAQAVEAVFGPSRPPMTSTKGVTGHALGAAGALEAAAVLLSMQHRMIPPTAGTTRLSDEMHVDVVIGEPRPWEPGPTISNNFGFGGHNGSVIIGPPITDG
jgi:3-oxoacyl-[acyl-carrier-protein] synthase II